MKRLIGLCSTFIVVIATLSADKALAKIYRWVDDEGQVHYSERPPTNKKVESVDINKPQKLNSNGSGIEQYKKLQAGIVSDAKKDDDQQSAKSAKDEEYQQQLKEYCASARAELATLQRGGRIAKPTADGETALMGDEQIAAAIKVAQQKIAKDCQ